MTDTMEIAAEDVGEVAPLVFSDVADPLCKLLLDAASQGDDVIFDCHISPEGMIRETDEDEDGEKTTRELRVGTVEFMAARGFGNEAPVCMMRNEFGGDLYIDRRPTGNRDDEAIELAGEGADPFYRLMRHAARVGLSIRVVPFIMPVPDPAGDYLPVAGIYAHIPGIDSDSVDMHRNAAGNEIYPSLGVTGEGLRGTRDKPLAY